MVVADGVVPFGVALDLDPAALHIVVVACRLFFTSAYSAHRFDLVRSDRLDKAAVVP